MKKYCLNLAILLVLFPQAAVVAQQRAVTIVPAFPQRGQRVTITYHTDGRAAKIPRNAKEVKLVFTYSTLFELPYELCLRKKGNDWSATFVLPRYFTYATFYFKDGDIIDKPAKDKHYSLAAFTKERLRVENGYLYEAYSLPAQMGRSDSLGIKQAMLYKDELKYYPDNYEAKLRLYRYQIGQAKGQKKVELTEKANQLIAKKFYEAPTVMNNINQVTMGYLILGENSRLDSIRHVVMEKYPHSAPAKEFLTSVAAKEKDTLKRVILLENALNDETTENADSYSGIHEMLFDYYVAHGNKEKALYHAGKMAEIKNPYTPSTLKDIAERLTENDVALDSAVTYADKALRMSDSFPVGIIRYFPQFGYIPSYVDDSVRKAEVGRVQGNLSALKGVIFAKKGDTLQANKFASLAVARSTDNETLKEVASVYEMINKPEGAVDAYRKMLVNSPSDSAASLLLKENYIRYHGSDKGLDQVYQAIENAWRSRMIPELNKTRLNKKFPDITGLVNLEGQPVKMDSLKGKVIVMDFWATWCVPCMHEMPYLQKVYDKFSDDPRVVFMVTNSGANNSLEDARKWQMRMDYTFPVYYTSDLHVGDKLDFNVIPALFVVDKNGNIQFKTIGFEGPEVQSILTLKIELLLQERTTQLSIK